MYSTILSTYSFGKSKLKILVISVTGKQMQKQCVCICMCLSVYISFNVDSIKIQATKFPTLKTQGVLEKLSGPVFKVRSCQ